MNKHVILLSAAAVLLFSCSREPEQVIQPGETITFTAGWAGSEDTRTILQEDGTSVWWEPGAQVNVFFSDKASGKFTSTNSQAQAIVDFQGSLPIVVGSVETENPPHAYWAVYPYNAANTCDGESVTLSVPATQTAKEGSFANKMFPSIATSTNFYLAFYNICGGVRFTVANEGIVSVSFKANNGESLAGKVQVGFDGVPVVKSVVEGASEVVVNSPDGGFVPGKYYFAALLPQTLAKGVSLEFKNSSGKVASTSLDNSITINRSRLGKMDEKDKGLVFKDDGSGHDPTDNIVFADSKVKERLVAKFDTNGDGELSYAEAAAVTSIEGVLTIKTITSFDEFQYFTGVKYVPDECFNDCAKLQSIIFPDSVTQIGNGAFNNCTNLASIELSQSLKIIGESAFRLCSSLSSVVLPNGLTDIKSGAFACCESLSSLIIPESVTLIEDSAFNACISLTSIIIPDGITVIEGFTFTGCTNLASVSIPDSVKEIQASAFNECSSLSLISIPDGLTTLGENAFLNCSSLPSISIPGGVAVIPKYAFSGCSSLSSVILSEGIITIEEGAFKDCSSILSLNIPESLTEIWTYAFDGCCGIKSISVDPNNPVYDSRDNCNAIIFTDNDTLVLGCMNTIIPNSVSYIGYRAFLKCTNLVSITIPENVIRIEYSAFEGCTGLTAITIPENVIEFNSAFRGCTSLKTVTLAEGLTNIVGGFIDCTGLESIVIPESVKDMSGAFQGCTSLVSVNIPDGIKQLGAGTFNGCTSLASIQIPDGVISIGYNCFVNCSSLQSIILPEGMTELGPQAFYKCGRLSYVKLLAKTPPQGGIKMFDNTNCKIYVPSGSVDTYKTAQYWNNYAGRIQAIEE